MSDPKKPMSGPKMHSKIGLSNMTPFVHSGFKICWHCEARHPEKEMHVKHPVPGLTVWVCPACWQKQKE